MVGGGIVVMAGKVTESVNVWDRRWPRRWCFGRFEEEVVWVACGGDGLRLAG